MLKSIEQLDQEKAEKDEMNDWINRLQTFITSHAKLLEDNKNNILTVENFVEKYLPIKIQTQISDTLKEVADKKTK